MKLDRNKRSYIADISSTLVGFYSIATNQARMEVFFLKIFIVLWGKCACPRGSSPRYLQLAQHLLRLRFWHLFKAICMVDITQRIASISIRDAHLGYTGQDWRYSALASSSLSTLFSCSYHRLLQQLQRERETSHELSNGIQ